MNNKIYVFIIVIFISNFAICQNNCAYIDTIVYNHSKYNELEQEIIVKHYFLSEIDFNLLNVEETRLRVKNDILSKYRSHDFTLFYNGKEFVSPYDLFSLITNVTEYDFVFPITSYNIDMDSFENMFLHDKQKIAPRWGFQSVELFFYSDEKLIESLSTSFPIFKSKIKKIANKSTRFIIEIKNKYNDSLKAEFFIKEKVH